MNDRTLESCQTCAFFLRVRNKGSCRKNPPTVVVMLPGKNELAASPDVESHWPEVKETDWCGAYAEKRAV